MSPQPSRSKTHLTQPLSLCLLTIAALTLLPGIKGAGAIATNPNPLHPPVELPQQIAQSSDARKAEADRLLQQGIEQSQRIEFDEALQSWQQALAIYRQLQDRVGEVNTLDKLGTASMEIQKYSEAIGYFQQELAIAQEIKDRSAEERARYGMKKAEADRLYRQGVNKTGRGDVKEALQSWQQALAIYREIQDHTGELNTLDNLGTTSMNPKTSEQLAIVTNYFQQELTLAQEIKDSSHEERARSYLEAVNRIGVGVKAAQLSAQGDEQYKTGQFEAALQSWQQVLIYCGNPCEAITLLKNVADAYRSLGNYAKAIEYGERSLAMMQKHSNDSLTEMISRGQTPKSMELIKDEVLTNLGDNYFALGNYTQALDYYQQGLFIARDLSAPLDTWTLLNKVGRVYYALGDYAKALDYQQQSLAAWPTIYGSVREQGRGQALGELGRTYYALGDYAKALDYQQQSLTIARAVKDRQGEGESLGNLGLVYDALGEYSKAIDYSQQWLAIARETKDRLGEGTSLNNLGLTLFKSGRLAEAELPLLASIQIYESLRQNLQDTQKVSIADIQRRPYNTLQQVLIAQNKIEPALEIAERGRARAFAELLVKRIQSTEQPTIQPIQITAIKQVAREQKATLVEYSQINDEQLFIWVVKPNGEVAFRKVDLTPLKQQNTTLEELVFNSRDAIGVRGLSVIGAAPRPGTQQKQEANLTEQLQQLHKLLIAPIADLLPTDPNTHVIFLPQGSLFLTPFAAVQNPQGKYLIEQQTILVAPSIQVLELTHKQRQQVQKADRQQVLVVGNPKMPLQLPPLPGAEQEAKAIATLLHTQAILGAQATKAAIVQQMLNARLIHLATHGILDDQQGLASAIALAPNGTGEKTDGLLTADEILNLKLNAELVVLSACDTGRGRITGDGVIGLSRSLITAGVPSVLVSLWAVPDAPTASLMQGFYQQLQSNPDKAQALRQTMLSTLKQHPNPRDWAAFVLIGEAQ